MARRMFIKWSEIRCVVCLPMLLVLAGAAPPKKPEVSAHEKAARDFYHAVGGADLAASGAEAMMGMMLQDPNMAEYTEVFHAWYRKVFAAADLEAEMVKLYMDSFSEKDLRELTAFYKSPLGQKALARLPEMMKQGAEIGMSRAQEHYDELEEMLSKAREEREKQLPETDEKAQKRTVADLRNIGTAMFSWLTDNVGAGAAGQSQTETQVPDVSLKDYPPISHEDLGKILVPNYIQSIPETDGWGNPYEFYLNVENTMAEQVMSIRSPGRDGSFSTSTYSVGPFDPIDFDEDIVWSDGFFVRWPQKKD